MLIAHGGGATWRRLVRGHQSWRCKLCAAYTARPCLLELCATSSAAAASSCAMSASTPLCADEALVLLPLTACFALVAAACTEAAA